MSFNFFTNIFTPGSVADNSSIRCTSYSNSTLGLYDDYMGIPQNLLINVIAWLVSNVNQWVNE